MTDSRTRIPNSKSLTNVITGATSTECDVCENCVVILAKTVISL